MFEPSNRTDPETGRRRSWPDSTGWDVDEGADVADVFRELRAMSGLPVDVTITRRYGTAAKLERRAVIDVADDTTEVHGTTDRGVRITVEGAAPIVLSEAEFLVARLSPGSVEATFRHLEVMISRVSLTWWRAAA